LFNETEANERGASWREKKTNSHCVTRNLLNVVVVAGKSLYNYIVITLITLGASVLLALQVGRGVRYVPGRVGAMRAVKPRCLDHPVCRWS
jgi:hypothetical protein